MESINRPDPPATHGFVHEPGLRQLRRPAPAAHFVPRLPLWKLQTVGSERLEFLYDDRESENPREITLKPGVAYCFRQFHSLVTEMVQGARTQHVRRTNDEVLGPVGELRHFLFGTERQDLSRYRVILEDVQEGRCFYCRRRLRDTVAVDHFVPWRRYPFDLAHNFVLAHDRCNGRKGDRLAACRTWSGGRSGTRTRCTSCPGGSRRPGWCTTGSRR